MSAPRRTVRVGRIVLTGAPVPSGREEALRALVGAEVARALEAGGWPDASAHVVRAEVRRASLGAAGERDVARAVARAVADAVARVGGAGEGR